MMTPFLEHRAPLVLLLLACLVRPIVFQQIPAPNLDEPSLDSGIPTPLSNIWARASHHFERSLSNVSYVAAHLQIDRMVQEAFKLFMRLYNKTYSPEEIPKRLKLFSENKKLVDESVIDYKQGRSSFALRVNQFTDWDDSEIQSLSGTELVEDELAVHDNDTMQSNGAQYMETRATETIPASKDWRQSGCISAPINQEDCGACYAIATMSVLESMKCINGVSSPILSPQHIVDCAGTRQGYQNFGCNGGWPTRVLNYLQDYNVAVREVCYPFVHKQNYCKLQQMKQQAGCTMAASPSGRRKLAYQVLRNENDILYHVAKTGPVVTVMKATRKFTMLWTGIFDDLSCSNRRNDVDHAIVIVGYGRENGVDYWLIKNSWGSTDWGEGGFAKYRRGKNSCSIGHWGWVITG